MSGDDGYFPSGTSVLRRVQGERSVGLLYGQRALCIGALKPLNFVGTDEHTRHRDEPFKRLTITGRMFETIFFGSRAEADKVLEAVHAMHARVKGTLSEDCGPAFPKGTRYAALDPELMLWTIAVAADSAVVFYELLVRKLSAAEKDAFWADYVRFGALFGMPREVAPGSWRAFKTWFDGELAGDELHLTPRARETGYAVAFRIPFAAHLQGAKVVHDLVVAGSLPPRVRDLYGVRWTPAHQAAWMAAVRAVRASRPITPKRIARGYNTGHFKQIAANEARRLAA
jgi:uncharacterized protein (DUF2236 family)